MEFIDRIRLVIEDLKRNQFHKLISLFRDYRFDNNQFKESNLEILLTKVMYTFYEDFFYSKRYFKGNEYFDIFNQEYQKLWGSIYSYLTQKEKKEINLFKDFRSFINLLRTMAHHESIQISEKYSIPEGNFDIRTFLEGLLYVVHDFDEWRLFSRVQSFQVIIKYLTNIITKKLGEVYKNSEVNFFSIGLSGSPIGYCVQQELRNYGYKMVKVYFIDDKIYTPTKEALRNTYPKTFSNTPIFIYDSVIKTGFNKYYISGVIKKIFKDFHLPMELPIYYIVTVNFQRFHKTENQIKNAFKDFNFYIISIYDAQEKRKGSKQLKEIYKDRIFWEELNVWFFDVVKLMKDELNKIQKCKLCSNILRDFDLSFFHRIEDRQLLFFRNIQFIEENLKYCDSCKSLYFSILDQDKIEIIRNELLNMRIS